MEVERLGEIFVEAGEQPKLLLSRSLVTGQCNGLFPRLPLLRFDHQLETASIRQPDVTHQHVEPQIAKQAQGVLHVARGRDLVTAMNQKIRKNDSTIFMVLDQQDIHIGSIAATVAIACAKGGTGRGQTKFKTAGLCASSSGNKRPQRSTALETAKLLDAAATVRGGYIFAATDAADYAGGLALDDRRGRSCSGYQPAR
jgi:hypothetical protein